jgi:hypothetical protein
MKELSGETRLLLSSVVAYLHVILVVVAASYLLWRRREWDPIYVLLVFFILLHWPALDDQCIFAIVFKHIKYGDTSKEHPKDMEVLLGQYWDRFIFPLLIIIELVTICVIFWDAGFPLVYLVMLVILVISALIYLYASLDDPWLMYKEFIYILVIYVITIMYVFAYARKTV